MTDRIVCPRDPAGHHWHLDKETSWLEEEPKRWSIPWTVAGILVPIFGWMFIAMYAMETNWKRLGVKRRWYCEFCRAFETTEHLDTPRGYE